MFQNISHSEKMADQLVNFLGQDDIPSCSKGEEIKRELVKMIHQNPSLSGILFQRVIDIYAGRIDEICKYYQDA